MTPVHGCCASSNKGKAIIKARGLYSGSLCQDVGLSIFYVEFVKKKLENTVSQIEQQQKIFLFVARLLWKGLSGLNFDIFKGKIKQTIQPRKTVHFQGSQAQRRTPKAAFLFHWNTETKID